MRTSRNMAYYPPDYVERIQLIKRLQEDRFMPLRVIKGMMDEDPDRAPRAGRVRGPDHRARAGAARGERACPPPRSQQRYDIPRNVLDRLAELGVLTPNVAGL